MAEETNSQDQEKKLFEIGYDMNTLGEVYGSPIEGFVGSIMSLASGIRAASKGGKQKILIGEVEPCYKNEDDEELKKALKRIYYASGGWLGSKTEYSWEPVTLREKKEEPTPTPYPYPYPYPTPYTPNSPYGNPYIKNPKNLSNPGDGITVNPIPESRTYTPGWAKDIDKWLKKGG